MVSVITLTYNRAEKVKEAIESIYNQSYRDYEIIVVDDGSEDNTKDVLHQFNNDNFKYIYTEHLGNLSQLRNMGFKNARGDLIAFLDSDDLWHPDKLQFQVELLESNPEADYIVSDVMVEQDQIIEQLHSFDFNEEYVKGDFGKFYLKDKFPLFPSALLFKTSCLNILKSFDESLEAGDHDFFTRLMFHFQGILMQKKLTTIRRHSTNHSEIYKLQPIDDYLYTLEKLIKKGLISRQFYRECRSLILYKKALYLNKRNDRAAARIAFLDSFKANPFMWKGLLRYISG